MVTPSQPQVHCGMHNSGAGRRRANQLYFWSDSGMLLSICGIPDTCTHRAGTCHVRAPDPPLVPHSSLSRIPCKVECHPVKGGHSWRMHFEKTRLPARRGWKQNHKFFEDTHSQLGPLPMGAAIRRSASFFWQIGSVTRDLTMAGVSPGPVLYHAAVKTSCEALKNGRSDRKKRVSQI